MENLLENIFSVGTLFIAVFITALLILGFIAIFWIMWYAIFKDLEPEDFVMEDVYKEVYFEKYCQTCVHKELNEKDDPCDECLSNPTNLYSHKPVNYISVKKE